MVAKARGFGGLRGNGDGGGVVSVSFGRGDYAENGPLAGVLREDNDMKGCDGSVAGCAEGKGEGRCGDIRKASDPLQCADDGGMVEGAAAVFSAPDLCGGGGLDYCCVDVATGERTGLRRVADATQEVGAIVGDCGEREFQLGSLSSLGDGAQGVRRVVPDELLLAIDDHLWRVVVVDLKAARICGLAGGELARGETVVPAERVPVVDVLAEGDDVGGGHGLVAIQAGEEVVRGRATGAAFGGEELDENRRAVV